MNKMKPQEIKTVIDRYRNDFPVKVGAIAKELNIALVSTAELPPNTSGSLVKEADGRYTIYVDQNDSQRRQRFTIAHELGHFVQHGHAEILEKYGELLNPRKTVFTRPSNGTNFQEIEKEADNYAADLLMPKAEFVKTWNDAETLSEVADKFGVSSMAANVRAAILGLGVFR